MARIASRVTTEIARLDVTDEIREHISGLLADARWRANPFQIEDEWNPTPAEVRAWAYEPFALSPTEDWHIAVTTDERSGLILRLACDLSCPSRNFFLGCLYLFVGDAVRSGFLVRRREAVVDLLAQVPSDSPPDVKRWVGRATALLAGPSDAVDYELWCAGGYARAERLR